MSNILLSYPRTGSDWTRYILECFSGQVVDGYYRKQSVHSIIRTKGLSTIDNIDEKEMFATMLHDSVAIKDVPKKLCISYRNPIEVIPSYIYSENKKNKKIPIDQWLKNNLKEKDLKKKMGQYKTNIRYYNNYNGQKMILIYENLINKPEKEIEKLTKFFGIFSDKKMKEFMNKYKQHKELVLNYKKMPQHMSVNTDGGKKNILNFIPSEIKQVIEKEFKEYIPK